MWAWELKLEKATRAESERTLDLQQKLGEVWPWHLHLPIGVQEPDAYSMQCWWHKSQPSIISYSQPTNVNDITSTCQGSVSSHLVL